MFVLAVDMFSGLFPPGIMNFVVPGAIVAGLFCYVIYKLMKEMGWIDGL